MQAVPFNYVAELATDFGAVECWWRESDRSFSGFVAEVWFEKQPAEFARRWASVVGYPITVRRRSDGFAAFAISIPCTIPDPDRSIPDRSVPRLRSTTKSTLRSATSIGSN